MSEGAVAYHEPSIITLLTQSSFILALNVIDHVLDKAIYCGLIGQILVGMAWGTPGADILGPAFQQAITDLGYLGLILIVFEGGLSTDMKALRSNLVLSLFVALTGITLPIGLSFLLVKMCNATTLQSFAAGCALSSTSLGTTFTILKSSGLGHSRLGVILTSAAMLDDVVGLVLVQVIGNLGASAGGDFSAVMIVRPVFVSIGYAAVVPVLLYLFVVLGPGVGMSSWASSKVGTAVALSQWKFIIYTLLLVGAVASAAYAGTSVLYAAYLAGLLVSSGEDHRRDLQKMRRSSSPAAAEVEGQGKSSPDLSAPRDTNESWELVTPNPDPVEHRDTVSNATAPERKSDKHTVRKDPDNSGIPSMSASTQTTPIDHTDSDDSIYDMYYATVVSRLLKGFFFGSIGLSIPITKLFNPPTLWRGLIYSLLMALGKLSCGVWLVRFSRSTTTTSTPPSQFPPATSNTKTTSTTHPNLQPLRTTLLQYKPQSLYPASILGTAMIARGEIGFLISAIAQANGIFESDSESAAAEQHGDLFLIVTWAILVCTIVGPVSVGLLTRRVRRIRKSGSGSGREDPLGMWNDL